MKMISVITFTLICAAAAVFGSAVEDNLKGIEALNAGRFDEAIGYFTYAHKADPENTAIKNNLSTAYNNTAMYYEKKGDFPAAYELMKKARKLDPSSKQLKTNFAQILTNESFKRYEAKNGQDIIQPLKEAVKYDGTLINARILLGQAYYERDEYSRAQEQWKKVLELSPANEVVQKKLEMLNKEMKGDDELMNEGRFHFKVRYEGAEMWTASREVLEMLEEAGKNASWKFGVYPKEQVTVIIYTQAQFQAVTGKSDWFAGVYDGKIRLRRSDVEGDKRWLRQIVYHEYMHAYVYHIAGGKVPVWLNEGIAQCYENMPDKAVVSPGEKALIKRRLEKGIPTFEEIDKMFLSTASREDVQFAYAYSKAFVAYVIEKQWDSNIRYMLEELAKGLDVDKAFDKVFFWRLEQLRSDWLFSIKQ